jgi:hypothetical protein
MNTLGAILGYLLFMSLYSLFKSKKSLKLTYRAKSPIIKHEALIYLLCSFIGIFLLFNPYKETTLALIVNNSPLSLQVRKVLRDGFYNIRDFIR